MLGGFGRWPRLKRIWQSNSQPSFHKKKGDRMRSLHEHMGQAIAYVRSMGMKAPWPYPLKNLDRIVAGKVWE